MGNKIKINKAKDSNVIGGNVTGNISNKSINSLREDNTNDKITNLNKIIDNVTSKTGIILMTIFILSLIVLFVITR